MAELNIDACIIPATDTHISEYVPEHYKALYYLSGFSGSAGTLVITPDFAGLWTDFRYFQQAPKQLKGSGFELVPLKVQHTPEYIDWLGEHLKSNSTIAYDDRVLAAWLGKKIQQELSHKVIKTLHIDIPGMLWPVRPALPQEKSWLIPSSDAGASIATKIRSVRNELLKRKSDYLLTSSLDEVAWLFNMRGQDVSYNPVVLSFALIKPTEAILFIDKNKLSVEDTETLLNQGVTILEYHSIAETLSHLEQEKTIILDPQKTNYHLYRLLSSQLKIMESMSPVAFLKAIKNPIEIQNMKDAMRKDGIAITRFCKWLEENIASSTITELSAAAQLTAFRAQQPNFAGPSFATIAGYGANAALPHYTPDEQTDTRLHPEGLFLFDSGGQYFYGTTDITRMLPLGEIPEQAKKDYTLVLMALIEGTTAIFPEGTFGYQIDALCRRPLWEHGINYGHGTGHGVGSYLNVHEGPQNIGPANVQVAVQEGMITSIEPGIYRPEKYGIRIENLTLAVSKGNTEFAAFVGFETLTLAHIDTSLIDKGMLSNKHINWLNSYHEHVYRSLSPQLSPDEDRWLKEKTRAL